MKIPGLLGIALVTIAVNVHAYDQSCTTANNCVSIDTRTSEERAADDKRRSEERARKEAEIRSVGLPQQRREEAERLLALQRAAAAARGEQTPVSPPSKPESTPSIPPPPPRVCKWSPKTEDRFGSSAVSIAEARARLAARPGPVCTRGSPSQISPVTCDKFSDSAYTCRYTWVCAQGREVCTGGPVGASRQ